MSRDFESLPSGENAGVPKDWFAGERGHWSLGLQQRFSPRYIYLVTAILNPLII